MTILFKSLISLALAMIVLSTASCVNDVDGMFNNITNSQVALREQEKAWSKQFGSHEISRLQITRLVRDRGGDCITEASDWKKVNFDNKLTHQTDKVSIACYFDVRGRFPWDMLKHWRWTVLLSPRPTGDFAVLAFRRSQGGEFGSPETSERNFQIRVQNYSESKGDRRGARDS